MDELLEKGYQWLTWGPDDFREAGLDRELPRAAAAKLRERFDRASGGFDGIPEEREDYVLLFLLEYARRGSDDWARAMAEVTLDRRGGHGGPLLAYAHLEAYAQTGRPDYREAACGILDGALKTLRLPAGSFVRQAGTAAETVWNAQMIAALAKASRVLGEETYLQAAQDARLFVKTRLTQSNGRLRRFWQSRTAIGEGRLEDYGLYIWALTELYETDFSVSCLREAGLLADRMTDVFRDPEGGFYDVTGKGGGAAALALSRLARLTAAGQYRDLAWEQLAWLGDAPDGLALLGAVEELWPRRELVCACAGKIPAWLAVVGEEYRFAPLAKTHDNARGLENAAPFTVAFPVPKTGTRLYLCQEGRCETAAEDLVQLYQRLSPEGAAV